MCIDPDDCGMCPAPTVPPSPSSVPSPSNVISLTAKKKERNHRVCGDGCPWVLPPLIEACVKGEVPNEAISLRFDCPLCGAEYTA